MSSSTLSLCGMDKVFLRSPLSVVYQSKLFVSSLMMVGLAFKREKKSFRVTNSIPSFMSNSSLMLLLDDDLWNQLFQWCLWNVFQLCLRRVFFFGVTKQWTQHIKRIRREDDATESLMNISLVSCGLSMKWFSFGPDPEWRLCRVFSGRCTFHMRHDQTITTRVKPASSPFSFN